MGERHDYVALDWVKGEIEETLKQSRQSLEAFVESPEDMTKMRFCLTYIHQVHGTLQLVEFYGAALLAEEMEGLCRAIMDSSVSDQRAALEVLMQGILQLPGYLEHVQHGRRDLPLILLPLLNDIRSVRGEALMSETSLFSPDLSKQNPPLSDAALNKFGSEQFMAALRKMRQMYQRALVGILRDKDLVASLGLLAKLFTKLHQISGQSPKGKIWIIGLGLVEGIANKGIELSDSVKPLLAQLDKELKKIIDEGVDTFNQPAAEDLLKNSLYYIAKCNTDTATIRGIKLEYRLDEALPDAKELTAERERLAGPDNATVSTVLGALIEDLGHIKDQLDLLVRGEQSDMSGLDDLHTRLKQVADTMGVIGLGMPRQVVQEQLEKISQVITNGSSDDTFLMDVAGALLYVEATLSGMVEDGRMSLNDDEDSRFDSAQSAVIREARNILEQAKDCIIEFIAGQWNRDHIDDLPPLLGGLRGSLSMIGINRVAEVLGQAGSFVSEQLLSNDDKPDWATLDTLADAITGIEYYLERVSEDGKGTNESILDVAEESVAKLGYPVAAPEKEELEAEIPAPVEPVVEVVAEESVHPVDTPVIEEVPVETTLVDDSVAEVEATSSAVVELDASADGEDLIESEEIISVDIVPDEVIEEPMLEEIPSTETQPVVEAIEAEAAPEPEPEPEPEIIAEEEEEDDLIDDEIIEIFLEEAEEVLEDIGSAWPVFKANNDDAEALATTRRAFHTLKGSGRMVKAMVVGELSWSIESLFNRLLEHSIQMSSEFADIVDQVIEILPELVSDFEHRRKTKIDVNTLSQYADKIAVGESVAPLAEVYSAGATDSVDPIADEVVLEPVAETDSVADVEELTDLEDESSEEVDFALIDIFRSEAESHLAEIVGFIQLATEEEYVTPLTDAVQRALHTLKGSANMAGIMAIGVVSAPLEHLVKDLRSYQVANNQGIVDVLSQGAALIQIGIDQLDTTPFGEIEGSDALLASVAELEGLLLEPLINESGEGSDKAVDPQVLSMFLAEGMDILLDAENVLNGWATQTEPEEALARLISELNSLSKGAELADLPEVIDLSHAIRNFYQSVSAGTNIIDDSRLELVHQAHEQLLSMMDYIAAGQSLLPATETIEQLEALIVVTQDQSVEVLESEEPLFAEIELLEDIPVMETEELTSTDEELLVDIEDAAGNDDIAFEASITEDASFTEDAQTTDFNEIEEDLVSDLGEDVSADEPLDDIIDSESTEFNDEFLANDEEGTAEVLADVVDHSESESLDELENLVVDEIDFTSLDADGIKSVKEDLMTLMSATDPEVVEEVVENDDSLLDLETAEVSEVAEIEPEEIPTDLNSLDQYESTEDEEESTPIVAAVTSSALESLNLSEDDAELVEIFLEEAKEIMETSAGSLERWISDTDNLLEVAELQRDLHTLKGGARMAELNSIGDLCHELESLYEGLSDGRLTAKPELYGLLHQCHDRLSDMLTNVESHLMPADEAQLVSAVKAYLQGKPVELVEEASLSSQPLEYVADEVAPVEVEPAAVAQSVADTLDEDDLEILEIFMEEAHELLEEMDASVQAWQASPTDHKQAEELQRILHTLKGGARLANLTEIGDLSHEFEANLLKAQLENVEADNAFFANVHQQYDLLVARVESVDQQLKGVDVAAPEITVIDPVNESVDEESSGDNIVPLGKSDGPSLSLVNEDPAQVVPFNKVPDDEPQAAVAPVSEHATPAEAPGVTRKAPQEMVKVSSKLLENLVNLAGETSITRGRLEQHVTDFGFTLDEMDGTLDRLRDQLRRLDIETEAQILFRQERTGPSYDDFDPLEMDRYSQLQTLSKALVESASDLLDLKETLVEKGKDAETLLLQQSRVNTELQEGLMKTRMVPFSRLVPRLRRIVRQVSTELGKKVEMQVFNAEGEMDRTVLERMISPLEHMLRNAVDHGIESIEDRIAAGKTDTGTIQLRLDREGGEVVIRLIDDGKGVNLNAVRNKAIARGMITEDSDLSDHEIMQFILQAGFSTAEKVTQISGRGVGMDVVNSEIKQMGGAVIINSVESQGTEFVVRLPFTVSVNRALMVRVGDDLYAIPLNSIEGIVRISPYELEEYYSSDQPIFKYAERDYHLDHLGHTLMKAQRPSVQGHTSPLPVILVRGAESIALQVDGLLGSREIVVKTLGPQFSSVPGVSGGTILGDGSVVIILDLPALIRNSLDALENRVEVPQLEQQAAAIVEEERPTKILVVDDSVTVRKVTTRLLERNGYEVEVAKDGLDAVAVLQDYIPDMMLLDIEMPRMDGFELATHVLHDSRLKHIPICMITSRTGEKHKQRAMQIGVADYMGKPFVEAKLLETIERLTER